MRVALYFSDFFHVRPRTVEGFGAFNVSLVSDLPLFIDPFLLFNSKKPEYRELHDEIITYLKFLRERSTTQNLEEGHLKAWYRFPEVKQNWLGFTVSGNKGSGLGRDFAEALHENLNRIFSDFGAESLKLTKGTHLEKLCLIRDGVGKDHISDFTTNLIHGFLLAYTQKFARKHIKQEFRDRFPVDRVRFNYDTETWERGTFDLPRFGKDYVLLTPRDMLTRDDTWINRHDLLDEFDDLPEAIPNSALRAQINNYFLKALGRRHGRKEERAAAASTIQRFPELIDAYIRLKEDDGIRAESISSQKVNFSQRLYIEQFKQLPQLLSKLTDFYSISGDTYEDAHRRIVFLKDIIENKGGHRLFYVGGEPIQREEDVHILYRLTWYGTAHDVSREVDDGCGPADFKISLGARDKSIVEFKLAKNKSLKKNLEKQAEVYQRASDAQKSIKVIVYFFKREKDRVERILKELKLETSPNIVLIDARRDNKASGSKA